MRLSLLLKIALGAVLLTPSVAAAQVDLRPELEKAFETHQAAIVRKDAEAFKRTLASYRYRKMSNKALSRGEEFPGPFFEEFIKYNLMDLKKLQHVETVRRGGDVAYVAYFSREAEDDASESRPVLTYLLFVKEAGQWKFAEGERSRLPAREAGVAPSQLVKEYPPQFRESEGALAGNVPTAPPEYPRPDFLGGIIATAENCKVTLKYNAEADSVEDSTMSWPMTGGLKRGKNSIQIIVGPLPPGAAAPQDPSAKPRAVVEVWVYADRATPRTKVLDFQTDRLGVFDKEFTVTDDSLKVSEEK